MLWIRIRWDPESDLLSEKKVETVFTKEQNSTFSKEHFFKFVYQIKYPVPVPVFFFHFRQLKFKKQIN